MTATRKICWNNIFTTSRLHPLLEHIYFYKKSSRSLIIWVILRFKSIYWSGDASQIIRPNMALEFTRGKLFQLLVLHFHNHWWKFLLFTLHRKYTCLLETMFRCADRYYVYEAWTFFHSAPTAKPPKQAGKCGKKFILFQGKYIFSRSQFLRASFSVEFGNSFETVLIFVANLGSTLFLFSFCINFIQSGQVVIAVNYSKIIINGVLRLQAHKHSLTKNELVILSWKLGVFTSRFSKALNSAWRTILFSFVH